MATLGDIKESLKGYSSILSYKLELLPEPSPAQFLCPEIARKVASSGGGAAAYEGFLNKYHGIWQSTLSLLSMMQGFTQTAER